MKENYNVLSFFLNDKIMLSIVVINTITIFVGGYWQGSRFFIWLDAFFTILFLAEAYAKIKHYGWAGYWPDNWNKFNL